jgi:mevalonate pyrophosphate decarboxylase
MQTSAARAIAVRMACASTMHAIVTTSGPGLIVRRKKSAQMIAPIGDLATMAHVFAILVMSV